MLRIIKNFLNGLAFGITETVPGVSGSTIAIMLGFYDEAIHSINHFSLDYRRSFRFVIPLLIGIALGILIFSSIMDFLLDNYSFPTMALFIGLVVGIIPQVHSKVRAHPYRFEFKTVILVIVPIVLLVVLSFMKNPEPTEPAEAIKTISIPFMVFILLAGIIAAAALVVPSISGSFILLLLGLYHLVMYSVSSIRLAFSDTTLLLNVCKVLCPLAIGILIGGFSMSKLIEKLLKSHHKVTFSIILGLLIGSVFVLFSDSSTYQSGMSTLMVILGVFTFACGVTASFMLSKKNV
ncbi:MAG: DUF368 domain-containing protein [Dehalococcoidia bacterium]|nr:DUF368 domain-containing protein [Dehalococcoidia bacterium]